MKKPNITIFLKNQILPNMERLLKITHAFTQSKRYILEIKRLDLVFLSLMLKDNSWEFYLICWFCSKSEDRIIIQHYLKKFVLFYGDVYKPITNNHIQLLQIKKSFEFVSHQKQECKSKIIWRYSTMKMNRFSFLTSEYKEILSHAITSSESGIKT